MSSSTAQVPTGVSNEMYDLISILYHSLESCSTEQTYIEDAKKVGDNDLVQFFQQCQQKDRQCAQQAQQLLKQKMH